jgi:predicted PurR-regulated permease PerM
MVSDRGASVARLVAVSMVVIVATVIARPFLLGVLWAMLLAYWTWSIRGACVRYLGRTLAALLLTACVIVIVALPTLWGAREMRDVLARLSNASDAAAKFDALLAQLHGWLAILPVIGESVANIVPATSAGFELEEMLRSWSDALGGFAAMVLTRAGSGMFHIVIAVLTLFFLYRDGAGWLASVQARVIGWCGDDGRRALDTIHNTLAAVTRGVLLAAVLQGAIAGIGYWVAGLPNPIALAMLSAAIALVPFGAALVWLPAAAWLAASGQTVAALGLLAWGVLVVSTVDNILRPVLMHNQVSLSFWPLTLSLIGGTLAFGLPGVYLGPVVYSLIALWCHQDAAESAGADSLPRSRWTR